jgi:hypothetical protein
MHKGSELYVINQNNNPKVLVEESILKFREDQDFNAEYLVAYTESGSNALLLKKLKSHKYKAVIFTNGKGDTLLTLLSIRNFVNGICDFYWINNTLYDRHHNKLFKVCKAILDEVTYNTEYPLTQLKNDIYISIGLTSLGTIVLLSSKKNLLFTSVKYIDPKVNRKCSTQDEVFYIDGYAFTDLNINVLLAKLKQQDTIDEMKEVVQKELAFNSI